MEEGTDDDTNIYSCFPELLEENFMMSNPETVYHYMTYKSTNIHTLILEFSYITLTFLIDVWS